MSRKSAPSTVAASLRILANDITSPDNVPALCLREAAGLIEAQAVEIERLRDDALELAGEVAAHVPVFPRGEGVHWCSICGTRPNDTHASWCNLGLALRIVSADKTLRHEDETSDNARKYGMKE